MRDSTRHTSSERFAGLRRKFAWIEKSSLRVALIVHDLHNSGGHSLYTRKLADYLSTHHRVTVFANRCERPDACLWSFQSVRAWRRTALTTVQTFPLGIATMAAQLGDFDIRHMQGYCGGSPNVVTAHICIAAYSNSLQSARVRHRASLRMMAAAEERFYRRYDGNIIAISEKVARELREFYQVRSPLSIVPHGVDAHHYQNPALADSGARLRKANGISPDSTVALYVGDLTKSHTHLRAITRAAPDIHFVIVTRSRQYHWQGDNVHILPPAQDIASYYAMADSFVFPTTYDAFGLVVLEAMAAGLAVFTSDCAGVAELISHGRDGFVIPLSEWVETTVAGLRDRSRCKQVGRAAVQTAEKYHWRRTAERVERIYGEVVGAARTARTA